MKKTLILCDFDGTVTESDTTDMLLTNFANNKWEDIGKKYVNGNISHAEMNTKFAQMLNATPSEIDVALRQSMPRGDFHQFITSLNFNKTEIIVVSSGWYYYIEKTLGRYNPYRFSDLSSTHALEKFKIPVISNDILYDKNIGTWNIQLLWEKYSCKLSSPCKGTILQAFRNNYDKIIAIGNSESDICMIEKADISFAFGTLQKICETQNIPCQNVKNFTEIKNQIQTLNT